MKRTELMLSIVNKPEYQPRVKNSNGIESTWCNHAAIEIIEKLGFESRHFLNPGGVGWTDANNIYRNARLATIEKNMRQLTEQEAIKETNSGGCVIVCAFNINGGHGHVAVVAPEEVPYRKLGSCAVIQAGTKNGRFNLKEVFNFPELTHPLFVKCRRKV